MEVRISNELYVFFIMFLCGVCAGVLFDIMRMIRRVFGTNVFTTSLADILFWTIIGLGIYMAIFVFNYGKIRWYEIMGVGFGGVIYFLSLSSILIKIMGIFLKIFKKIFRLIFKIILTPLFFLYKMIKRPLSCVVVKIRCVFGRLGAKNSKLFSKARAGLKKFRLVLKKS